MKVGKRLGEVVDGKEGEVMGKVEMGTAGGEVENGQNGEENTLKSRVSQAETCEDEKGKSRREDSSEQWLSLELQQQDADIDGLSVCQDFSNQGFCMSGQNCKNLHEISPYQPNKHKSQQIRRWLFEQIPQLVVFPSKRIASFLS